MLTHECPQRRLTYARRYMAPEVFRHEPYNSKVDVYAFSMICFQLFEGMPPFWMLDPVDAARKASTAGKARWLLCLLRVDDVT